MTEIKSYGDTQDEMDVQDRIQCREIVSEILNFGVSQSQILQLIFFGPELVNFQTITRGVDQ